MTIFNSCPEKVGPGDPRPLDVVGVLPLFFILLLFFRLCQSRHLVQELQQPLLLLHQLLLLGVGGGGVGRLADPEGVAVSEVAVLLDPS